MILELKINNNFNKRNFMMSIYNMPDVLENKNGSRCKNIDDWQKRREEIKQILFENEYGYPPEKLSPKIEINTIDKDYCGGMAVYEVIKFIFENEKERFVIPVDYVYPKTRNRNKQFPLILYLKFRSGIPDKFLPVEGIVDNGFIVATFRYTDVTLDNDDFTDGLAKFFKRDHSSSNFGKIMVWAQFAIMVLDHLITQKIVDKNNIIVGGHSRLGKTALLIGALDDRVKFVIANDSGCSGATIARNTTGETVEQITTAFPYWFCKNYKKYAQNVDKMPFDQHFLLSLIAPRYILIGTAKEDKWADNNNQFLCCKMINPVFKLYDKIGIEEIDIPKINKDYNNGNIHFHERKGTHYHTRNDWLRYLKYIKQKIKMKE